MKQITKLANKFERKLAQHEQEGYDIFIEKGQATRNGPSQSQNLIDDVNKQTLKALTNIHSIRDHILTQGDTTVAYRMKEVCEALRGFNNTVSKLLKVY